MPDEVNIDELLELESEEDRSRKIQVGERESCPPPPCTFLKITIVHMFTEHLLCAGHCFSYFPLNTFNPYKSCEGCMVSIFQMRKMI